MTPATYALPMLLPMRCCDAGKGYGSASVAREWRRLLRCCLCAVATLGSVASYKACHLGLLPSGRPGGGLHAAGNAEGRCDSRQDADDELDDKLKGFFLHSFKG